MKSDSIYVEAPARLHLGFLDLEGGLNRRFGSIGLAITDISTEIRAKNADQIIITGDPTGRVQKYAEKFIARKGLLGGCEIKLLQRIPDHSGLGSGTQLALAVGTAISKLKGIDSNTTDIVKTLNRGARSGIGLGAFQQGGFLVDAGRGSDSSHPPIVSRLEFPSNWRVLLILDSSLQGVHGQDEYASFTALPPFPAETAAYLCRLVMMQVLPAVSEQNIDTFSQGIFELQQRLGEYFASAQGGRYTSTAVANAVAHLESLGIQGVGQSSWGPTGFAFVDSETKAHAMMRELKTKFGNNDFLEFRIVSGRNVGAEISQQKLEQQDAITLSKANRS